MTRAMRAFFLALGTGALIWGAPVFTFAYTSPGTPHGYVNDFAHVLSATGIQSIEQELKTFDASTSIQIAVVTIPTLGNDYIENYAVKLFEDWKIGHAEKDTGVLLLLAIQEHKIKIETGYGVEGALPDSIAAQIISSMGDKLRANDYDGAISGATQDIERATQNEYQGNGSTAYTDSGSNSFNPTFIFVIGIFLLQWLGAILGRSKSWWLGGVLGGISGIGVWYFFIPTLIAGAFVTVLLTCLGLLFDFIVSRTYDKYKSSGGSGNFPWFIGGGGFGGSSGGSSFGGFGGGSSGGGGASGSW